jgi:hypothetical protein
MAKGLVGAAGVPVLLVAIVGVVVDVVESDAVAPYTDSNIYISIIERT